MNATEVVVACASVVAASGLSYEIGVRRGVDRAIAVGRAFTCRLDNKHWKSQAEINFDEGARAVVDEIEARR